VEKTHTHVRKCHQHGVGTSKGAKEHCGALRQGALSSESSTKRTGFNQDSDTMIQIKPEHQKGLLRPQGGSSGRERTPRMQPFDGPAANKTNLGAVQWF